MTLTLAAARTEAGGGKPEDVFKGRIMITKKRLPLHFSSAGAFISAVQSSKTDKLWPTSEDGADKGVWDVEYIAFFAQPLNDSEIQVKFYDITAGKKYVAGDAQYTRDKESRVFASSIQLSKPEFDVRHHYMMTAESRGRIVATTSFWLLGKGANYSGKVEFSDADAKGH
ncbi:MAG TPA: hypothetical protein VH560_14270 [Polyangia bacterium]|nr:hypothetical protein [Polyangia bacterium]